MKSNGKILKGCIVLGWVLLLGFPAVSSLTSMATFYKGGAMDFDYTGSATGGFSARGAVQFLSDFPVDEDGATIGYYITSTEPGSEGAMFLGYGGVVNPDQTMDILYFWIVRDGQTSLSPGSYTIDNEESVLATFFDDADDILINMGGPPVVISAARFCNAQTGGTITFDAVNHTGATGRITCTFQDEDDPGFTVSTTDCPFTMSTSGVPNQNMTWGEVKAQY